MLQEDHFRNKVNWISIICAVLVVFLHSYSFNGGEQNTFAYNLEFFISRSLAKTSVPTFFALSAFLFYRNFDFSKLMSKFRSRFYTLIVPYVIWNFISMVIFYFLSRLPFINTETFCWSLETVIDGVIFYKYNLVFWFVFQLILLTYLFPLLYPVLKKQLVAVLIFLALVALYGSGYVYIWKIEIRALIYYFLGAYFAVHHKKFIEKNNYSSIWGILAFIAAQILIYSDQAEEPLIKIISRILLIVAVFDFSNLLSGKKLPALFNCSFPIYAMHNLILEFFNKIFSFFLSPESNLILIDYFGSTIMTILIIAAVNVFMIKYFPRMHRVLFGGRGK